MQKISGLLFIIFTVLFSEHAMAQQVMTPELLWKVGRVSAIGLSEDAQILYYKVSTPNMESNGFDTKKYRYDFKSGDSNEVEETPGLKNNDLSPSGNWQIVPSKEKIIQVLGKDRYGDVPQSNAYIHDGLHHRHWDSWREGVFQHLVLESTTGEARRDIMKDEPYDCPTVPFGGSEDYTWSPDGNTVVYVCKKRFGTAYVNSTNTDLYAYNVNTESTVNLTADNPGYDTHPAYSKQGTLAWLSMARDGYENDKNDLKILFEGNTINLTSAWDGTVDEFIWANDGRSIFFIAPVDGTKQLYSVGIPDRKGKAAGVAQITKGQWDITGIVAQRGDALLVGRSDMNRANELYSVDLKTGGMRALTKVNEAFYAGIHTGKVEARMVPTADGKEMLVWVAYPPDFDSAKKYPTLLYAQGGPQSALSQFYSFRWNFQVMAAQGYIVVAPNRRGMPGHGVEWNEQISGDWGGLNMQDYLSAIDHIAKEPYVDNDRIGCIGASYGGYSVFYLAGIHEGRFKTFISHCGIVNLQSMYGNTEELFFANWDIGGPYWEMDNEKAQRSYSKFNPIDRVGLWDTPMLIIQGGKDYRVPDGQAFEAFTAAQQRGIKSRLLYFPDENHWVLKPHNALVWQREFFRWLKETL